MSPIRTLIVAGAVLLATGLTVTAPASGARGLATGIGDENYVFSDSQAQRDSLLDRTVDVGASTVRLHVRWRFIAGHSPPASASDPADPSYDFAALDAAVIGARQRGLEPVLMIFDAPAWAEGAGRPPVSDHVRAGTWKPSPGKLREFSEALARRYSGAFAGLPRVRRFQIWNEQNLFAYLTPQYQGGRSVAPQHYVRMLNAAYAGIKGVSRNNYVVTGGTAPYGDPPGDDRTRPLAFWRKALCLKGRRKLDGTPCKPKAKFDALAHHPINLSGGPTRSAAHPDDASTPDLGNVRKVLRAAERENTVGTGGRHALWATEFWWQSKPPVNDIGIPLGKHARWYQRALYEIWRDGASVAMILQVADTTVPGSLKTGLYTADGQPKPALRAFRFPFVPVARGGSVRAWGRSPAAGRVVIERKRGGGWRRVGSARVGRGGVFNKKVSVPRGARLRARVGGDTSLADKAK